MDQLDVSSGRGRELFEVPTANHGCVLSIGALLLDDLFGGDLTEILLVVGDGCR